MLEVRARNLGNVTFLCLQGQIVSGDKETLREAVCSQADALPDLSAIVLDLSLVSIVDAGCLGMMLELREQLQAKGIRFALMNVTKWVSKVLQVSRLDSVFEVISGFEFFPSISLNRAAAALASCA
jgi:anti-anti-sigma factor